jgi:hypothetical protein
MRYHGRVDASDAVFQQIRRERLFRRVREQAASSVYEDVGLSASQVYAVALTDVQKAGRVFVILPRQGALSLSEKEWQSAARGEQPREAQRQRPVCLFSPEYVPALGEEEKEQQVIAAESS